MIPSMALISLIYVSSARQELSTEELTRILESSVRHNTAQHLTGMLLYSNGSFMQVLEGEETAVDETYLRIQQDPRHTGSIVIERAQISARSFGLWRMGFKGLDANDVVANTAFIPFLKSGFDAAALGAKNGAALEILKRFALSQGG
jgi:hypothetical protein